ncbi:hypothetical protein [Aeromonas veronii]|uniref:hypothetical protein n=1 Tax=Aeromonas veronii TaxID=654 RepID=UPI0012F682C8|nr:hypothetical protein [Aeromonas veronii]QGW96257.1 hypothetical protein FGM04_06635 [Aeromonas veronii]HDO1382822.1 hypothetical protein [Aeromonas veronii]HDO1386005.1 hypothetical protein [Aeromonas veronii]
MVRILTEYKDFLPVATFILGYVFNELIGVVKNRSNLQKIKKLLDYEINRNLDMLVLSLEKTDDESRDEIRQFNISKTIARISEAMTSNVFDNHISELSKMKEYEIDNYFSFYSSLAILKLHSQELIKLVQIKERQEAESQQMLARGAAITMLASAMLKIRIVKS